MQIFRGAAIVNSNMNLSNKIRLFITCGYLSLLPIYGTAQRQSNFFITGKIINASQNVLPGITIRIQDTDKGAVTKADGTFKIGVAFKGDYTLNVSGLGYEARTIAVAVANRAVEVPTIVLEESIDVLNEVVIKGKSQEQEKREEPIRIDVIDTKKLQVQSLSLPQVINQTSGVKVRQGGGIGSNVVININGLEGNAIRYFKDDIPLDYLGNAFNLSLLPIDQLENIEVYKGVLPVKLGIDALGGGVNFLTKPNLANFVDASVSYGTFNTLQANVNGLYNIKNTPLFIGFDGYHVSSDNDFENEVLIANDMAQFDTVNVTRFHDKIETYYGSLRAGIKDHFLADLWEVSYARFDLEDEVQNGTSLEEAFGEVMYFETADIFTHRYKRTLGQFTADLFVSYSEVNTFLLDTATIVYRWDGTILPDVQGVNGETSPSGFIRNLKFENWTGRLYATYDLGENHQIMLNHNLVDSYRIGSDPRSIFDNNFDRFTVPALYQRNVSGLGITSEFEKLNLKNQASFKRYQVNSELIDRRREFNDRQIVIDDAFYGAGNSTKYSFDDDRFLRLSYEYTTRIPEAQDYFGDGLFQLQNPELVPERSHNINLGYYSYLDRQKNYWVDLNFFYRYVNDNIQTIPLGLTSQTQNTDDVRSVGAELVVKGEIIEDLRFNAALTYQEVRLVNIGNNATGRINEGARLANLPFAFANLNLTYRTELFNLSGHWNFYLNYSFTEKYLLSTIPRRLEPALFEEIGNFTDGIIPTQHLVDAGASYEFSKLPFTIALDVYNVLNDQIFDNFRLQRPGRMLTAKVRYQFKKF
ncbi:MAG: carboxypeptidase-like regulatory domain-containing protein [Bacteroidota bacterium]